MFEGPISAKVERLVNLTVALLESRRPMTLHELRRRTGYYTQDDAETARRMFERDKDALRGLGVPIEVGHDPLTGEAGYFVDRRAYELPDVDLTREEVAALALAVRLTGEPDDRLALSKLAARAPDPTDVDEATDTRVALGTEAIDEVAAALLQRQSLRFRYRSAAGTESERTIDPHGVALRRGAWYVVGHDHDRDDVRAFRLDRVVGGIRAIGAPGPYELPSEVDISGQVAGPSAGEVDVEVAVSPDARWAVEVRGGEATGETHAGRPVYRLRGADPVRLVPWVLGLGPDAVVLSPVSLREGVQQRLTALAARS